MATTQLTKPHKRVGEAIFDDLVKTTAVLCESDIDDDGTLALSDCKNTAYGVLNNHGLTTYVFCIEASEKHTKHDVGVYDGDGLGEELEIVAIDAVVEAALDTLIEKDIIDRDDVLL